MCMLHAGCPHGWESESSERTWNKKGLSSLTRGSFWSSSAYLSVVGRLLFPHAFVLRCLDFLLVSLRESVAGKNLSGDASSHEVERRLLSSGDVLAVSF